MPPKLLIQIGFVLVAILVFVVRAIWAAQQAREEDEMFLGKTSSDREQPSPYRRSDPNSAWEDQRRLAAIEAEQQRAEQPRESLRDHNRGFAQRVARDVDTSDVQSQIGAQLHSKFDDRHVGTLDSGSAAPSVVAETADSSAAWSNDPARIRDAFILREILARPEQRWSEAD